MIVPMKKAVLLALNSEKENALRTLRDAGVMQIISSGKLSENGTRLTEQLEREKKLVAALEKIMPSSHKVTVTGAEAMKQTEKLFAARQTLEAEKEQLDRKIAQATPWGKYSRKTIQELKANGVPLHFCTASRRDFEAAQAMKGFCCKLISDDGKLCYFTMIGSAHLPEKLTEVMLEKREDTQELEELLRANRKNQEENNAELSKLAGSALENMRKICADSAAALDFCKAADAMTQSGAVVYLTGFVPEPSLDIIRAKAKENGWGLLIRDPEDSDDVPVLLKNNRLTRIIQPLFDFLGILPGYREMDVSFGVLIFFTIFYAMIIGDAGYGSIFLIISLIAKYLLRKKKAAQTPVNFFILLSVATVVWGALSGSWFGIPDMPGLKCLTDPVVKNSNIQAFCFLLAFAQLAFGRIWRAFFEGGFRSFVRHAGWVLILFGNLILTLRIIVWPGAFPSYMYWIYAAGLVFVMFADVNWKNPADCFQFPFNIIGSFTDVLSYIRLFAVGIAGSCIAASFNQMGMSLSHIAVWCIPFGILAILAGHLLNIPLCFMSVLVHGVRLNTLEFSNHTGLSWSGQSYKPFKNHYDNEEGSQK